MTFLKQKQEHFVAKHKKSTAKKRKKKKHHYGGHHAPAVPPEISINRPLNHPAVTNVLDSGRTVRYYISCFGDIKHANPPQLSKIWAIVLTAPFSNIPTVPPAGAKKGYVSPGSVNFQFFGSTKSANGGKNLIEVQNPGLASRQYLYVWALMSDGFRPDPELVTLKLAVAHKTDAGDTVP